MTLTVTVTTTSLYFSVILIHTLIVNVLTLIHMMLLSTAVSINIFLIKIICLSDTTRIWNSNPYSGMIRLQGGNFSNEGRVEVYCNGQWGTICDNGFSSTDALTICKQLGYSYYYRYDHLSL